MPMLANNENSVPTGMPYKNTRLQANSRRNSHSLAAGRPKALKTNRGALADITNNNRHVSSRGLSKPRTRTSSNVSTKTRGGRPQSSHSRHQRKPVIDNSPMDIGLSSDEEMTTPIHDDISAFFMIDADDYKDSLTFGEYAHDIYSWHRSEEARMHASPSYMDSQRDINAKMREILIDWLVEVHLKFKLEQETLYLTVNIIDRFLERREVKRDKLQLVGCAAMLLASKYEEIYAPEVRDFVYISDQAYTREQILAMEEIMLRALQFDLTAPSTLKFADRFVKVTGHHNDERFKHMVNYLIELTLQDYRFVKYVPSMVAASAMFIALRTNSSHSMRDLAYTPLLERYTQYSKRALKECVSLMWKVLRADSPRYRAVRTKYSSRRFSDVARLDYSAANCSLFER